MNDECMSFVKTWGHYARIEPSDDALWVNYNWPCELGKCVNRQHTGLNIRIPRVKNSVLIASLCFGSEARVKVIRFRHVHVWEGVFMLQEALN